MPDVALELWKDDHGVRMTWTHETKSIDIDLTFESAGKVITALDDFLSEANAGDYRKCEFDLQEYEE